MGEVTNGIYGVRGMRNCTFVAFAASLIPLYNPKKSLGKALKPELNPRV
jgi:hypothetical protein